MTLSLLLSLLVACGEEPVTAPPRAEPSTAIASASRSEACWDPGITGEHPPGVLGNSLPGSWRPFSPDSPWNMPIDPGAPTHADSPQIIEFAMLQAAHIAFARSYTIPVWVVDSRLMTPVPVRSDKIYDTWDQDRDGWTDEGAPVAMTMWAEPTRDAHICIVDLARGLSWEMSRFSWLDPKTPTCTTYNIWELAGPGYDSPPEGTRWQLRGGRGSGFPIIAGLLRPEEIAEGAIRHALVFTYSQNRATPEGWDIFQSPPACRSDGDYVGYHYPILGMRFQLDPAADETDFDAWGLSEESRIVARALQEYGMYLGDQGGDMKIQVQLLSPDRDRNPSLWEQIFPGLYENIERIPTSRFRVVDTGEPTVRY